MARRTLHDRYFKDAKAQGYLARSAYKLIQIQQAKRILRPGDRVLDLGCAPGSWLQVTGQIIGDQGLIVGVDLTLVAHPAGILPENARTIVADVTTLTRQDVLREGDSLFTVVLSDMAPNTTGHGDDLRSATLCRSVIKLLPQLLAPGGNLVMKILEGAQYPTVLKETACVFASARGFKPKASRDVSREMFIIATGYAPHRHTARNTSPNE